MRAVIRERYGFDSLAIRDDSSPRLASATTRPLGSPPRALSGRRRPPKLRPCAG
jgi:hypothetical protein